MDAGSDWRDDEVEDDGSRDNTAERPQGEAETAKPERVEGNPAAEVEIRTLALESAERVLELWRKAILPHRPLGRDAPSALAEEFSRNRDLTLGAYVDGELVGTILATDDGRKGWINRLAVDPACRQAGIGTRLLKEAEMGLRRRGRRIVAALVEEWNTSSIRFFQAKGYRLHSDIHYLSKREGEEI